MGRSNQADSFILKGAILFAAWTGRLYRPTRDLDLLGFEDPSAERLASLFRSVCATDVEEDGLRFDSTAVTCEPIRDGQAYGGMRVRLLAFLETARIRLQIDVGFGDAVAPAAEITQFPTLLDHPEPTIWAYPVETVVAEKMEAIVTLGMANSRIKDFYDLRVILSEFELDDTLLREVIQATFDRRRTAMPTTIPVAFTDEFMTDQIKQRQWKGFLTRSDSAATWNSPRQLLSSEIVSFR